MTSQEFSELYDEYWKHVYWVCFHVLKEEDLATDAAQEVFCQKWKVIGTYNSTLGGFKNWLTHNAYHHCIDLLRRRGRRPEEQLKSDDIHQFQPSGTRQVEWRVVLTEAMRQLTDEEKLVLKLRRIEGFTLQETNQMMGLTTSQVRTLQDNALRKLRDWLVAAGIENLETEDLD
ncbi:ECF RNA polymerase sigma factor SigK [Abditibacteriota bacterium]|nr:ECF RNA polymerase sigma factor SigK [Abditibacteriota bacterium]